MDQIERFSKIEDYGAAKASDLPLSIEDRRALKILEDTTTFIYGRYEVGLLWKKDEPQLPNNRALTERRAEMLRRRLTRAGYEEIAAKYRAVMTEYISKGYARKRTGEEAAKESSCTWYLPHHPVTNPNKPGKLRIVFDAAAEFAGTSLNKNLLQGPDMTNSLVRVLRAFVKERLGWLQTWKRCFTKCECERKIKTPYASCGGQITTLNLQMSMSLKYTYLVLRRLPLSQILS